MAHIKALAMAVALFGLALPGTSSAEGLRAQPMQVKDAVGEYQTKFEEVSNNCKNTGINMSKATVKLERVKGRSIALTVPLVPFLRGAVRKGGKFRAKAKKGKTAIRGVDGRFSAGGRVGDGKIQFVFIAEYFRGKQPLCTQSWNATGTKK